MEQKNLKLRNFDDGCLLSSTVVAIKEAKKTLASFSLELKKFLPFGTFDKNLLKNRNSHKEKSDYISKQNSLYKAEVNLFATQEKIQTQFINLLLVEFTKYSKYPNQINDLIEYINTNLKPNQHEVQVLIDESKYLHILLSDSNFKGNRNELLNKLFLNNMEVQKISKMNLEDDLIQRIKDNSVDSNRINKSIDLLYAENKSTINNIKIMKLRKQRSFIAETSRKNLEMLKEVQHNQPKKKTALAQFDFSKTLSAIEKPIIMRNDELLDVLNKVKTVAKDILKAN